MECLDRIGTRLAALRAVQLAYVFGSVARGEAREGSDLDVAVLGERPLDPGEEEVVRSAVELVTHRDVHLIDLAKAPPLLLAEVVREGVAVLVRDEERKAEFEVWAIAQFLDTAYMRSVQHAHLRERVRGRRAGKT